MNQRLPLWSKLLSNVGLLTVSSVSARVISAVTVIWITRSLGPDGFGPYISSLALARLSAIVFGLGLNTWLLRSGGRDSQRLKTHIGSVISIKSILGPLWLVGLLVGVRFLNPDSFPFALVLLAALAVWLEDMTMTAATAFQSQLRNHLHALLILICQTLVLIVTAFVIWSGRSDAAAFLWARIGAATASTLIGFGLVWQQIGIRFQRQDWGYTLRETRSFAASVGLAMASRQADVTIVGNWLDKTAAGLYGPAVTLISTIFVLAQSVHGVLLPMLARMYEETPGKIWQLIRRVSALVALAAAGASIGLVMVAQPLVYLLYGPGFMVTGQILQVFSLLLFFRFMSAVTGAILAAVGWQRYRVYAQIVAVVLNIGLNLFVVLATDWGVFGVAAVYVLTEIILASGYLFFVWRFARHADPSPT